MTGFIGLGVMGTPMVLNLARVESGLTVWNRSAKKCEPLMAAGATVAPSVCELFAASRIVFLMLADEAAVDAVVARGTPAFEERVRGHIIVHMGTTAPHYSRQLSKDVREARGDYVECPVSGSRTPAEKGELIAMLAGNPSAVEEVRHLLTPMCRQAIMCGDVPNGLLMKLAVNIFLITTVTGLAEAFHFAEQHGLNMEQFRTIIDEGPMSSDVSRIKVGKMLNRDFSVQAAIFDVLKNNRLIAEEARASKTASPLLNVCYDLFGETFRLGHSHQDMAAVLLALQARTRAWPTG